MSVAMVHRADISIKIVEGHASEPEMTQFIAKIVRVAYESMKLPQLKNALADCGTYVDLKVEKLEVIKKLVRRIVMLVVKQKNALPQL